LGQEQKIDGKGGGRVSEVPLRGQNTEKALCSYIVWKCLLGRLVKMMPHFLALPTLFGVI